MPRMPRLQLPDGVYHVGTRGNNQAPIVLDDEDRWLFMAILGRTEVLHEWMCFAFCLMTNHYHAVLESSVVDLATGMHRLNGCYAQTFNRRHRRTGHLFERRYWSYAIEGDDDFTRVCEYVQNNPVRAGLCEHAADWPWSGGKLTPPSK